MVRARCSTRETLDNYYKELLVILQKYDLLDKPHRIFNVDETGVSCEHIPPKIVSARGRTPLAITSDRSATTTISSCISAIRQTLPPYMIFKGKKMTDDLLEGGLPGTQCTMSDSGWSNSKIFQTYLTEHFLKYVPTHKDDPLLLLYDGQFPRERTLDRMGRDTQCHPLLAAGPHKSPDPTTGRWGFWAIQDELLQRMSELSETKPWTSCDSL